MSLRPVKPAVVGVLHQKEQGPLRGPACEGQPPLPPALALAGLQGVFQQVAQNSTPLHVPQRDPRRNGQSQVRPDLLPLGGGAIIL